MQPAKIQSTTQASKQRVLFSLKRGKIFTGGGKQQIEYYKIYENMHRTKFVNKRCPVHYLHIPINSAVSNFAPTEVCFATIQFLYIFVPVYHLYRISIHSRTTNDNRNTPTQRP